MTSSNSDEQCRYDTDCEETARDACRGCGELYCAGHYSQHQAKVHEDLEKIKSTEDSIKQKWKSLTSKLSPEEVLTSIGPIYDFNVKLEEIEGLLAQLTFHHETYVENYIDDLRLKLERLNADFDKVLLSDRKQSESRASHPKNELETSQPRQCAMRLIIKNLRNSISRKSTDTSTVSQLLLKQESPSILNNGEGDYVVFHEEDDASSERGEEQEDEIIVYLDSDERSTINHKVRLNNNVVRYLRGPLKAMVKGTMHAFDYWAQGTQIDPAIIHSTNKLLGKQAENEARPGNSIKPTFTEITSDWKYEGRNSDEGYSSPSIWMRNPQGQRVMMKTEDLPLCAVNEWLAYVLGKELHLPVNEVQISVYENHLVTLHTDVANESEQVIPFMNLPRLLRKKLLKNPLMESMSIFDRIIQNVDRNQLNILITIPKTANIHPDINQVKMYLIDHASCFGMGKLNGISVVAAKFHSRHFSVVKFDPIHKSKQFEDYLNKLPVGDRSLISEVLNRFASITDDQFDRWLAEVKDLLSTNQYNRIQSVLRRQRDIARRYVEQWEISTSVYF